MPDPNRDARPRGLSWPRMLLLLLATLVAAVGLAYLLIAPFFHRTH